MRRQFKKQARVGRSVEDLYKQDRFERMRTDWIEARAGMEFTVQEYENAVRDFRVQCGLK